MKRLFPMPLMSVFIMAIWLMLNQTLDPGQILLAVILGLLIPFLTQSAQSHRAKVRHPLVIVKLFFIVLWDIILSNIAVSKIILGKSARSTHSGFIYIPLELRDPFGLAVLACIITSAPGTAWVEYDRNNNHVMLHILDMDDPNSTPEAIKSRYEHLLLKIFQS